MKEEHLLLHILRVSQKNKADIATLLTTSNDQNLNLVLKTQYLKYNSLIAASSNLLVARGIMPKNLGIFSRAKSALMKQTLSPSKLAKTLVHQAATDMAASLRKVEEYSGADPIIVKLAKNLCYTQEETVKQTSLFL